MIVRLEIGPDTRWNQLLLVTPVEMKKTILLYREEEFPTRML